MKFIKIFVAALAIFGLQLSVASAASPVKAAGVSVNKPAQQEHRHHITRHHLRHRPHRLRHKTNR